MSSRILLLHNEYARQLRNIWQCLCINCIQFRWSWIEGGGGMNGGHLYTGMTSNVVILLAAMGRTRFLQVLIFRCCYITLDYAATALQNGACTYRFIPKQTHYKIPLSHKGYMKSLWFSENHITLPVLKKKLFENIILTQNHAWYITYSGWNTI
jgi:hypothetical protein